MCFLNFHAVYGMQSVLQELLGTGALTSSGEGVLFPSDSPDRLILEAAQGHSATVHDFIVSNPQMASHQMFYTNDYNCIMCVGMCARVCFCEAVLCFSISSHFLNLLFSGLIFSVVNFMFIEVTLLLQIWGKFTKLWKDCPSGCLSSRPLEYCPVVAWCQCQPWDEGWRWWHCSSLLSIWVSHCNLIQFPCIQLWLRLYGEFSYTLAENCNFVE